MSLVLAHVSDLHVSTFGDTFHDRSRMVRRSARIADVSPWRYQLEAEENGWRVLADREARGRKLSLVDPDGYSHPVPSAKGENGDALERCLARARLLEARRAVTLAAAPSHSDASLAKALEVTPTNANIRLLRAVRAVAAAAPDVVLITGDITDDGDGYELVEAAFRPWFEAGRLFAVPGNHDRYLFPISGSTRPRPTQDTKRQKWRAFASRLNLHLHETGAWAKPFPDAQAIVVGLDTCARPQRRFFRHNGVVGPAQLAWLRELAGTKPWREAKHRLVLLHHHVVPLPHGVGRRAPSEIGMRLDDAKDVARELNECGATLVLHGHRHISEERYPAGLDFRLLAAPSLTLGCKSGQGPSFWRIELSDRCHVDRVPVPVAAVEQEDDPGVPSAAASSPENEVVTNDDD